MLLVFHNFLYNRLYNLYFIFLTLIATSSLTGQPSKVLPTFLAILVYVQLVDHSGTYVKTNRDEGKIHGVCYISQRFRNLFNQLAERVPFVRV